MPATSPARYVPPIALVIVAFAFFAIMASNGGDGDAARGRVVDAPAIGEQAGRTAPRPKRAYVVKAGDVASVIAERTGVSLQALEALNPGIDLRTIRPGQKLKLAR
jgi:LysM repeat protein